ncbi:MAG: cytochrome c3 family protein, partial [Flavobacteriales bacterium]|nr:cytochrome c3 family protein [Flavobacteriales bacterium]
SAFILFIFVLKIVFDTMMGIGVVEGYQPDQPIQFSHKIHAGVNGIDCNYCHSSARNSKTASVPSADLCMNCHTQIKTGTITGETEINKIYDAVGFNPETGKYIEDYQQKPIQWVRVHSLPDLTYFNHSQHVNVAGLECQQCHGNVEEKTVGQVAFKDELNKVQKNQDEGIKFKHPTLTMGWCIDCHRTKEIDMESNEYYADMHEKLKSDPKYQDKKITPALIGGMECGKCHY